MSVRAVKPVTVTLGPLESAARERVSAGRYASLSEVVRAGLRALDREEASLDAVMQARVAQALANPAPSIPQADVFATLRAHHAAKTKA
ncbi:MAG: type II toxin-antitoxin system ParD family antitoxin [Novosphingobium sp.]